EYNRIIINKTLYAVLHNKLKDSFNTRLEYFYDLERNDIYRRIEYFNIIINMILNPDPDRLNKYKNLKCEKRIINQVKNDLNNKINSELEKFNKRELLNHLSNHGGLLFDNQNLIHCEN